MSLANYATNPIVAATSGSSSGTPATGAYESMDQTRLAVLRALEQAYQQSNQDATTGATARAQSAGTYANTPEFLAGLNAEAANQGSGAQAALLPRIAAIRSQMNMPAFDPSAAEQSYPLPDYGTGFASHLTGQAPLATLNSNVRAGLLRELEAAYGGIGTDVANQFVGSADQAQIGDEDYLRSVQSDVQSGITGAENALQARINALRSAQGVEAFSDNQTAGQQADQAQQVTQAAATARTAPGAATTVATSAPRSDDAAENVAADNEANADTASQANAVTSAAKKRTAPKVL